MRNSATFSRCQVQMYANATTQKEEINNLREMGRRERVPMIENTKEISSMGILPWWVASYGSAPKPNTSVAHLILGRHVG